MALRPSCRAIERLLCTRSALPLPASRIGYARIRFYTSDTPPEPPLYQKIKADLKSAMRNKEKARLTAIRSVMAATLDAHKKLNPIKTDGQMLGLLRRSQRASADAKAEASAAGRDDLVEKEQEQIDILEEYITSSGVEELGGVQLEAIITDTVAAMKSHGEVKMGEVMKKLSEPDGPLTDKHADKAQIVQIVKKVLRSS
ncbi:GatB/YqeY domain-containing protein [Whalleya microplaca]|nr:GatB/YqeY domain-containing protein [Whalleya microplaca]